MSYEYKDKLENIIQNVKDRKYRFTIHALERRIERDISMNEIEDAILNEEIIEDYPRDKYLPNCLILGNMKRMRPLHIQVSCDPVWVITCYDPSGWSDEWSSDFKKRRRI